MEAHIIMKQNMLLKIFQAFLWMSVCIIGAACQPVKSIATATATTQPDIALTSTATPPQETPAAAPTEIGAWPLSPDQHLMVAQSRDGAWWMWDASSRHPIYLLNDT